MARAEPDGYTLFIGTVGPIVNNKFMYKNLDFDPDRAFAPIALLAFSPLIIVGSPKLPVKNLNELEWVKGEIYANVWQTDRIARIDPKTGHVVGWIDCAGLLSPNDPVGGDGAVLNGIAYDAATGRLFVTGKLWPKLFEIKLVKKAVR